MDTPNEMEVQSWRNDNPRFYRIQAL